MRILYGVQTTGNGHLSRSRLVISYLKQLGHRVHVIFSGADHSNFWDMSVFEPYNKFQGFSFIHENGKIKSFSTLVNLDINNFIKDTNTFSAAQFDLVISDFEPISAALARKYKIKSIGLSHQCAFAYKVPKANFNYIGKSIIKFFAPVDVPIGLHWHHFDQPVIPPIINHELRCDRPIEKNKILVYLPFENHNEIRKQLHHFKEHEFFVYENRDSARIEDNIHWQPLSRVNFVNDLKTSAGVFSQAGFELPSEALHLGKKLLVKPIRGQFEQLSNVTALKKIGCGLTTYTFDNKIFEHWLNQSMIEPAGYPNVAFEVAQWISEDPSLSVELLSDYLWSRTSHPPMYLNCLTV